MDVGRGPFGLIGPLLAQDRNAVRTSRQGAHFGLGMYISALSVLVLYIFCSITRAFCSFLAFLLDYASFLGRVGGFEDDKIRLFGCNSHH